MGLPRTGDFGWLRESGDPVVPVLRVIRRHGPGGARRGALLALVHLHGEDGVDAEDLAVVRRLIRIRRLTTRRTPSTRASTAGAGLLCARRGGGPEHRPVWTGWPDHVQVEDRH